MDRLALDNVHELFEWKLQGMYSAEKRTLDVLDDAVNETKDTKLREAFSHHRTETEEQVKRIEEVMRTLGHTPRTTDPSVVEGLIEEKRRFLSEDPTPEVIDVFNIAAGIKTEHLEIAAYESLLTLAEQMGGEDVAEPLRKNLSEEKATLEKLTKLAGESKASATPKAKKTETPRR